MHNVFHVFTLHASYININVTCNLHVIYIIPLPLGYEESRQ